MATKTDRQPAVQSKPTARQRARPGLGKQTGQRLLMLFTLIGLVGVGGYLGWGYQVERMSRGVLVQADEAEKKKEFAQAEGYYREYLAVAPKDEDALLKYAEVLLKSDRSPRRKQEVLAIYEEILKRPSGRDDVRRRAARLAVEMGEDKDAAGFEAARRHLAILLKAGGADGELEYLMGRSLEASQDTAGAARYYQLAIDHDAPQRLEAYSRRATLLRSDRPGQPDEADRLIEAMVRSDPNDYRVYLARGRYRRQFGQPGAKEDLEQALGRVRGRAFEEPGERAKAAEVYLEMARVVEGESGRDAAGKILDDGLKALPDTPALDQARAELEVRAGRLAEAIEVLERGLARMPDQVLMRFNLAMLLAERGETGKLLMQITELERFGVIPALVQYLNAYYHINKSEFARARQILAPLQAELARIPEWRARVGVLLGRCYGQLNEPDQQRQAYQRAIEANPQDLTARLGLIHWMARHGELDRAIEEYRGLLDRVPGVRIPLARLLIARTLQRSQSQRDWGEVERLIAAAARAAPESVEPVILQSVVVQEQGDLARAREMLAAARRQSPQSVELWIAEAEVLGRGKRYDEALALLDQARPQLGDRVPLRLIRARLWVAKGGTQVVEVLKDLAKDLESFSREDRRILLTNLATELGSQQQLAEATQLWSRLADQEPDDPEVRTQLMELALQNRDSREIEKHIQEMDRIDPVRARFFQARYQIWQAGRAEAGAARDRLRAEARARLNELKSQRPDWALVPLALAQLEEQELEQDGDRMDPAQKHQKQESLITSYLRAIDLGHRNGALVRRAAELLFTTGRGIEALQLYSRVPVATQLAGDLRRWAAQYHLAPREYQQPLEEIARKAVEQRPDDFRERLWLVIILWESGRTAEAEAELRRAIDRDPSNPDPWVVLVRLLIQTDQRPKAEQTIRDAQTKLAQAPLTLAQCCELMGRAFEGKSSDDQKKWYGEARTWYDKARAAVPRGGDDLMVARRLTEFLLGTNQVAEAEKQVDAMYSRATADRVAGLEAWARRVSAQIRIASPDIRKRKEALALFEPPGRERPTYDDPDDLRILARVLEAQGTAETAEYRRRAIAILESLVSRNLANPEDRLLLARIEEAAGDWPKARDQFRELIVRTESPRDLETRNRRPGYLFQFGDALLRHHQPGQDQDLAEVQDLIGRLKQIQPDLLSIVILQVELDRVRNRIDEAAALIRSYAERSELAPMARFRLAQMAEQLGRHELAEPLYRRLATDGADLATRLALAQFLGRRGRIKEALDVCEPLWSQPRNRESVTRTAMMILFPSENLNHAPEPAQADRLVGWLEQGVAQDPRATILMIGLGNLHDRMGRYARAEEYYRKAIELNDREGTALNNLAWLIALKDGRASEALKLINDAIQLRGPLPDFLDTRGIVYLTGGDDRRAIADLEIAVQADPSPSKLFHLAQAHLRHNDRQKAEHYLKTAKTKGLPTGLHPLELTAYHRVLKELGTP